MSAFISESERLTEFNKIYWSLKDIEYGNWYQGINNDGTFVYQNQIELTEVSILFFFIDI
jgi:hypothetical protein